MRYIRLPLAFCLVFGMLVSGTALAKDEAPRQEPNPALQDQQKSPPKAKVLPLETDHSAKEALDSLQGRSDGRGDGGHGEPSSGFGGMGPSHGGGPSPHR